jgi:hypothetical protein
LRPKCKGRDESRPYVYNAESIYAALRRLVTQLHVPQVQRIEEQSVHTVKSTEPK